MMENIKTVQRQLPARLVIKDIFATGLWLVSPRQLHARQDISARQEQPSMLKRLVQQAHMVLMALQLTKMRV